MATIQTSLQRLAGMAPELKKITDVIQTMIRSMEGAERTCERAFNQVQFQSVRAQLVSIDAGFGQIGASARIAWAQIEIMNRTAGEGEKKAHVLKEAWSKVKEGFGAVGIQLEPGEVFKEANDLRAAENRLKSQTSLKGDDLEMAKESMKNLYADDLGSDLEDVADGMAAVYQLSGETGGNLELLTRAGILLGDTFGYEIADSMKAAQTMERQFGISGLQAFDMIAQGAQAGLDKGGDFLDIINEYSFQFSKLGLESKDMFHMLINGSQNGMTSIDELGKAVKEFSSRAVDGSKTTQEGFQTIGLDPREMTAKFRSGGEAARNALQETMDAISHMDDPAEKDIAGEKLFGSIWQEMGSEGVMALSDINGPVQVTTDHLEKLNSLKYNDATTALAALGRTVNMGLAGLAGNAVEAATDNINAFTTGLKGDAGQIQGIFGTLGYAAGMIGRAISGHWSVIEPVLWGVIGALGVYYGAQTLAAGAVVISTGVHTALAAAQMAYAAVTGTLTAAKAADIAAQNGLNTAMYACPVVWIIGLIILLIAVFYGVVAAINHFAGTSISATGLIMGAFGVAGAYIANNLMALLELGLGVVEFFYNGWAAFANFFTNVFKDPIGSVIYMFADLGDCVLGIIEKIAQAIDFVFGSDLAGAVSGWRAGLWELADKGAEKFGNGKYEENFKKIDIDQVMADLGLNMERLDYGKSWEKGYQMGEGFGGNVKGVFDSFRDKLSGNNLGNDLQGAWEEIGRNTGGSAANTGNTAANTAAMANTMDVMDEELKYMRDAAEQEIINRFTLAELKVDMNNHNTLTKKTDFDDMGRALAIFTGEFLAAAAEGGHI